MGKIFQISRNNTKTQNGIHKSCTSWKVLYLKDYDNINVDWYDVNSQSSVCVTHYWVLFKSSLLLLSAATHRTGHTWRKTKLVLPSINLLILVNNTCYYYSLTPCSNPCSICSMLFLFHWHLSHVWFVVCIDVRIFFDWLLFSQ